MSNDLEKAAEVAALDALWRDRFADSAPLADHAELKRDILIQSGVSAETIDLAILQERSARGLFQG